MATSPLLQAREIAGDAASSTEADGIDPMIYPLVPWKVPRYKRERFIDNVDADCTVSALQDAFDLGTLPDGWKQLTHPEGQPYFYHASKRLVTDCWIWDPKMFQILSGFIATMEEFIRSKNLLQSEDADLILEITIEDGANWCGYYYASHSNRSLFWLESVDLSRHIGEVSGALSATHLNVQSSHATTINLTKDDLREMSDIVENAAMKDRFMNYHGQYGARLNQSQSVHNNKKRKHTPLIKSFSPLLFSAPNTHLRTLEALWIDQLTLKVRWTAFFAKLNAQWGEHILHASILLNANIAFLAIPSNDPSNNSGTLLAARSAAQVASYISVVTSFASMMLALLLVRQHKAKERDTEAVEEYHAYLLRHNKTKRGFEDLAIIYSLPYALLSWGMVTFLIAFLLMCFVKSTVVVRSVIGFSATLICGLIFWSIWMFWEETELRWRRRFRILLGLKVEGQAEAEQTPVHRWLTRIGELRSTFWRSTQKASSKRQRSPSEPAGPSSVKKAKVDNKKATAGKSTNNVVTIHTSETLPHIIRTAFDINRALDAVHQNTKSIGWTMTAFEKDRPPSILHQRILQDLRDMYKDAPLAYRMGKFEKPFNLTITRARCEFTGSISPDKYGSAPKLEVLYDNAAISGYGDNQALENKVDPTVRDAREITSDEFSVEPELLERISATWEAHFSAHARVRAAPYKIHVYGPGGHFKSHRDTPEKDLVGTFLIGIGDTIWGWDYLDEYYERLDQKKKTDGCFHIDGRSLRAKIGTWVAFFPDVPHSISALPAKAYRAVIAFKVFRDGDEGQLASAHQLVLQSRAETVLHAIPRPFGILLDHVYHMDITHLNGYDTTLLEAVKQRPDSIVHMFPVRLWTDSKVYYDDENEEGEPLIYNGRSTPTLEKEARAYVHLQKIPFFCRDFDRSAGVWHKEQEEINYRGNEADGNRETSVYLSYALLVLPKDGRPDKGYEDGEAWSKVSTRDGSNTDDEDEDGDVEENEEDVLYHRLYDQEDSSNEEEGSIEGEDILAGRHR
ncbi:hypothetical protein DXG01_011026 [Tephrocybe rancida]|nr:hypothetical protein DXG01_011026 [Tephrocybe rancida]